MPIQWAITAQRAALSVAEINALLQGDIHQNVANRLGLSIADVQAFIGGQAHANVAAWLGLNMAAATELAQNLGQRGVIGLLLARLMWP
jgi:hypothetical protein